jgi:hypothetical protein
MQLLEFYWYGQLASKQAGWQLPAACQHEPGNMSGK